MEDTPVLKWTLAALGVIVACFCLGYFVLGPSPRTQHVQPVGGVQVAEVPDGNTNGSVAIHPRPSPTPGLILEEQTDYEAKLKKAEEDKRKAEEARKKAEEALRLKELEMASPTPTPAPAIPEASPSPDATPTPNAEGASGDSNTAPSAASANAPDGDKSDTTKPDEVKTAPTPEVHVPTPKAVVARTAMPKSIPATPKSASPAPETKGTTGMLYRVQVGSYNTREAANTVAAELRGRLFSTLIVTEESGGKSTFHVQVGAFKSKTTAESTLRELQANGYDATMTQ